MQELKKMVMWYVDRLETADALREAAALLAVLLEAERRKTLSGASRHIPRRGRLLDGGTRRKQ